MIIKEIKCSHCGNWTTGNNSHCQHCGGLIDFKLVDRAERIERAEIEEQRRLKNESKFERLIKKLEASQNPLNRVAFRVLHIVWILYSALIAFVIWFTAIFSG